MNKREVVWLIIKLIGVYFVYLTVVSFFSLISSASALYSLPADPNATANSNSNNAVSPVAAPDGFPSVRQTNPTAKPNQTPTIDAATKKLRDEAIKTLLLNVFLTFIYGAVGFYLLRDGRLLFALLNREGKVSTEKEPEISSLGIFDEPK